MKTARASVSGGAGCLLLWVILLIGFHCSLRAAFARRWVIDPRGAKPPGHSRATAPQWGVRRRRKWQVNVKAQKRRFPPDPPRVVRPERNAAAFGAALVAEDSSEFLLTQKESSAKSPLGFLWSRLCSREPERTFVGMLGLRHEDSGHVAFSQNPVPAHAAALRPQRGSCGDFAKAFFRVKRKFKKSLCNQSRPECSRVPRTNR